MTERPLLIIDLEATCWEYRQTPNGEAQSNDNMEIIEIGCALATR
jgi:inhibitor of KinA sporulation pathway (predicted exonuclease)